MTYLPHGELVIRSWLQGVTGVPVFGIGTTLPADNSTWAASGFVQVSVVGGSPDPDVPRYQPVASIDCWAVELNSAQPPWGKSNQLAERIVNAGYGAVDAPSPPQRKVSLPTAYFDAEVQCAYALTHPKPMHNDDARFAHFQFDMQFVYVPLIGVV